MSQLPQGWTKSKLGEFVKLSNGFAFKSKDYVEAGENTVPVVRISDIQNGKATTENASHIALSKTDPKFLINKGDLLIAMSGATTGKTGVFKSDKEAYQNQRVGNLKLVDNENSCPRYRNYLIQSLQQDILKKAYGAAQPNISAKDLAEINVILAPFEDQKRIADKLDSVLAKVEAAQARLDKIPTILKRFRQSVLAAATSGELTKDWREENDNIQSAFEAYVLKRLSDRKKWEEIKLIEFREKKKFPSNDKWKAKYKEVALPNQEELQPLNSGWGYFYVENVASSAKYSMSSGPFGSALGRKDYTEAGVPVLRGQNVKNGVAGVGNFVFVSEEKATSIPRSLAYPGDVVVVAVGSSGVTGIIPPNISVTLLSQNCNKISVDNVLVRSEYFNLFLQSQVAQSQISAQTTDTVRQFFSLTNLKKTIIAVPPLQEQNEILLRVEELFEHANTVEKQYNAAKARLDKLTQSILAKAFRGELLSNDTLNVENEINQSKVEVSL